jgi:hypothetical protein
MEYDINREELALDALMAALLRQLETSPPTEKEIRDFLKTEKPLSPEAKAAIKRLGPDVVNRLILARNRSVTAESKQSESAPVFAAMNRKNVSGRHNPETEEELRRKRIEILERLKKKQRKDKK